MMNCTLSLWTIGKGYKISEKSVSLVKWSEMCKQAKKIYSLFSLVQNTGPLLIKFSDTQQTLRQKIELTAGIFKFSEVDSCCHRRVLSKLHHKENVFI